MSRALESFMQALERHECAPRGKTARCPAHDDRNASLSFSAGHDGRVLLQCHAGCDTADVVRALGLDFRDLFDGDAPKPWTASGMKRSGAKLRPDGRVTLGAITYLPGAPDGALKAIAAKGVKRDLWPAPESIPGPVLYVVEGEPDSQTGSELGLPTVGVPGANSWNATFAKRIGDGRKTVVILPDADDPGRAAAKRWAADLAEHCADVRVLELHADRNDGSDLSTYVADVRTDQERRVARDLILTAARMVAPVAAEREADTRQEAGLAVRLQDARVDLLTHDVAAQREYLPASGGMLPKGARVHIAAPMKSGKTLGMLVHTVNVCVAGGRVAILDRENGADEYARRLKAILADRPETTRQAITERLDYYQWPSLKLADGPELAQQLADRDLVIIDSTRTFLSSLALDEDRSDDFATYTGALVDPLFRQRITVVQLDNAGHGDGSRARGSSSKGDLADVIYSMKVTSAFDEHREGSILLKRERSRFGDIGAAFTMTLGAGHFGHFDAEGATTAESGWRPTHLMEKISRALENVPDGLTGRALQSAVGGKHDARELATELLISDGHINVKPGARGAHVHHSIKPYREPADDRPPTVPPLPMGTVTPTVPTVPLPTGTVDGGTHATTPTVPLASGNSHDQEAAA